MLPPELYGPAGALVALAFVIAAMLKDPPLLVPGWIYRRLEARAEKSDIQAERNSEALATLAKTVNEPRNPGA